MDNEDIYKFKNLPLRPEAIRQLILEIFPGQPPVHRREIIDTVRNAHIRQGGEVPTADVIPGFKKVLRKLAQEGLAENPALGFWKILSSTGQDPVAPDIFSKEDNSRIQPIKQTGTADHAWEKVIGSSESENSLYLYYFPTHKKWAELNEKESWQCKIGHTRQDPKKRVLNDQSTSYPERPILALLVKTPQAKVLEIAVHKILQYRGRWNKEAKNPSVGDEWFTTSPAEVLEIVAFIDPNLNKK